GKSEKVIFVSYFTIQPEIENVIPYLETFKTNVLNSSNAELYVLGKQVSDMIDENPKLKGIHLFSSLGSTISKI
ncbi:MAG TPA: MerR family transcriptional regulator, partial [Mangrovimonas sp.]|nr:MerR family transcriptional regulator [Mangrovimonas sp.]